MSLKMSPHGGSRMRSTFLVLIVLSFYLTTSHADHTKTPTRKATPNEIPFFIDDLDFKEMSLAISRQLKRFGAEAPQGSIQFGDDIYLKSDLIKSLKTFRRIYKIYLDCQKSSKSWCQLQFHKSILKTFNIYVPDLKPGDDRYGEEKSTFFTGYYTPEISASSVKTQTHKYEVYSRPKEDHLSTLTRLQIDFLKLLVGFGYELFYSNDLYDLYLLHIEGGGKTKFLNSFKSPQNYFLSYKGSNGQKFRFIASYMKEKGMLTDDLSIRAQRKYLEKHPEVWQDVYSSCENYIFFEPSHQPPIGSDDVSLTDNRSIATDRTLYSQKGVLTFVEARRPVEGQPTNAPNLEFKDFSRFFLDQDTGGAIKGKARADLYFGVGTYAELASHNITEKGKIFFLMSKK